MSVTHPDSALSPHGGEGESDDWRLLNDVEHLAGQSVEPTDGEELRQHMPLLTHCAFCWTEVCGTPHDRWYLPLDKSCCICEDCFRDFQARFGWRLLDGWDIQWPSPH